MFSIEIIFGFFFLLLIFKLTKRSNLPPGPWKLPFIGNVHQIGNSPFVDHSNFAKKLGDIHSVSMFGHTVVVLSSLEAMKLCNFSSSDVFSHRPTWLQNTVRCKNTTD